jgi:hypothetical protein
VPSQSSDLASAIDNDLLIRHWSGPRAAPKNYLVRYVGLRVDARSEESARPQRSRPHPAAAFGDCLAARTVRRRASSTKHVGSQRRREQPGLPARSKLYRCLNGSSCSADPLRAGGRRCV